jgi:hypothetical protein
LDEACYSQWRIGVGNLAGWRLMVAALLIPAAAAAQGGVETVIPEGTRISLQLNDYLSTKLNNEGDSFTATVSEPVYIKERAVIPKGSIVSGSVSRLLRPGRFKGKAVMNLLFSTIRIQGSPEMPIAASLVRVGERGAGGEGDIPAGSSTGKDIAKVAAPTATGAGIGAIVGGGKGAAIGAGLGAAIGLFSIGSGAHIEINRGAHMEIILDRPLTVK